MTRVWKALVGFIALLAQVSFSSAQPDMEFALSMNQLVYCTPSVIQEDARSENNWSLVGVFDPPSRESTQALAVIQDHPREMTVAFRGTQKSVPQWASNLEVKYDKWIQGRVHRGFHQRFLEVRDRVLSWIDSSPTSYLTLTGHSMGGAVATLMASFVRHTRPDKKVTLITFGSPRVGDQTFARFVDSQLGDHIQRVMNKYDMVTEVPPKVLGYRHVGRIHVCQENACEVGDRLAENPGGLAMALKRTIETVKNVKKWHLTYLGERIGTSECE